MAEQSKAPTPVLKTAVQAAPAAVKAAAPSSAPAAEKTKQAPSRKKAAPSSRKKSSRRKVPVAAKPPGKQAGALKNAAKMAETTLSASAGAARKAGQKTYTAATSASQTMEKLMSTQKNQFEKLTQDAASAGKEHMEAVIKSGSIFWNGFEHIMKTCANLAQETAEKQTQYLKKALGSKTINEWSEINNEAAQASVSDCMAAANRISELSVKIVTDSFEPINNQLSKSIKKATDTMAA